MNRSLALPVALTAFFALAPLTGCTIYTNSPSKAAQTAPASTAKGTTVKPRYILSNPHRKGGKGQQFDVPTVQSKTIFGGPTVAAFRGQAYVIPEGTTKLPNLDDLVPFGQLYTDDFAIASQTFSGGFPGALLQEEWFAIRYTGTVVSPTATKWTFKLVSDDGAILYIDGKKVIDNDGVHEAKTTTGDVELTAGNHALQLDYFQEKKGTVALQLFAVVAGQDVPVKGAR